MSWACLSIRDFTNLSWFQVIYEAVLGGDEEVLVGSVAGGGRWADLFSIVGGDNFSPFVFGLECIVFKCIFWGLIRF